MKKKYNLFIEKIILTVVLLHTNKPQLIIRLNQFNPFGLNNIIAGKNTTSLPNVNNNQLFLDIQSPFKQEKINIPLNI